jgi:integrase
VPGQRIKGTTKGGRSRTVSLDRDTVTVLREHRRQQAEERLAAGEALADTGGLVFVTRWGEPLYPYMVTALMTKLINQYNKEIGPRPSHSRVPGCMVFATCTPPHCCWQASRSTWSPPGSATPTRP